MVHGHKTETKKLAAAYFFKLFILYWSIAD